MSAPALPRSHDEYEALAVAWAIDALEPADQEIFEAHRPGCEVCARTVVTTLEVAAELAYGVPDIAPPPQLRSRLLAAATAQPPRPTVSPESAPSSGGFGPRSSRPDTLPTGRNADPDRSGGPSGPVDEGARSAGTRRPGQERPRGRSGRGEHRSVKAVSRRRRLATVLAAAALIGGSAATTWEITRPAPVSAPAAAAERVAALTAPDGQPTLATIVAKPGNAAVVTDGLTPNTGRGTSYYVWGVPAGDGGMPQVVGTFVVTSKGLHSYPIQLTRSPEDYPVLAVSEETAGSSPTTPSSVLARGPLGR
ncbi:MAG TPA: anti-sigma factor [Mycobacteriales bacterium]|nr:anti-sigma factor [Mycobacteriales bacterium]